MVILQVKRKVSQDIGALPSMDFVGKEVGVSQQFFLSEEIDKARKIKDELNEHFEKYEPEYRAMIIEKW